MDLNSFEFIIAVKYAFLSFWVNPLNQCIHKDKHPIIMHKRRKIIFIIPKVENQWADV